MIEYMFMVFANQSRNARNRMIILEGIKHQKTIVCLGSYFGFVQKADLKVK